MSFAQDLRASVLQAAMQGKLTEQLETDTPVSKLLADIKAEKDRLIVEKKIKKEKPLSTISDDDIPFDIPESWEFIRLGDISVLKNGYSFKNTEYKPTGIQIVRISDLSGNEISTKNAVYYAESEELNKYKIADNSILICMTGSIGKMALVKTAPKAYLNQRVGMLMPSKMVSLDYIYHYLNCEHVIFDWNTSKTSTNGNIKAEDITNIIIPLPPIEEQKRIVRRIEEIMKHIDELEAIEEELKKLKEVFPGDMKSAILQAAMQGKLTEQLETDSSVDDLLEKIAEEREQLVKGGKIKKPKPQNNNFVALEDTPFDIPSNWKWVKFEDIFYKITDGTHKTPKYTSRGIHFVSVKDVTSGFVDLSNTKFISEAEHNELFKRCDPQNGDLLITKVGTTGIPAIVNCNKPFSLFVSVALLKYPKHLLNTKYLYFALKSPVVYQQAQENTRGIGNKNWVLDDIKSTVFPLPPIEEQQRIVDKLETILPLIEDI